MVFRIVFMFRKENEKLDIFLFILVLGKFFCIEMFILEVNIYKVLLEG